MAGFVQKLLGLKQNEGALALRLGLFVFLCHSVQAAGKVLQYSVFLSEYGRDAIAWAFFLSAFVVAAVSLAFAGLVRQVGRRRLVAGTLAVVSAAGAIWRLWLQGFGWSGYAVYLFIEAASLLSVVLAWNVVNSVCNPRQARRVIPVVGLGASGAFLVNGLVISPLVGRGFAPRDVVWFVVAAAAGAAGLYLGGGLDEEPSPRSRPDEAMSGRDGFLSGVGHGLKNLWAVELLRVFTVATILMIVAQQFLNFAFLSSLQSRYDARGIAAFLGWFVAFLGVAQGLAQALVSGRVLSRIGGSFAASLAPSLVSAGALVYALALPSFWALVGLRFLDRLLKVAFYSPAIQSLYTPVARQTKLAAMALIKGVVSPAAYGTAAVGLMLFADVLGNRSLVLMVAATAGACALWLGLRGKRAYVAALESALARGSFSFDVEGAEGVHVGADKTVIEACKQALRSGGERQAAFALRLLSDLPRGLMAPVLDEALSSPHVLVRREAARLIMEQDVSLEESLAGRMLADSDGEVVATGLRLVADSVSGREAAGRKLSDPRPLVRACAALAFLDSSKRESPDGSREAGEFASEDGESSAGPDTEAAAMVLRALARSSEPGDRVDLTRAMAVMGLSVASDLLEPLLSDADWNVRAGAVQAVGRLGCSQFTEQVMAALEDRRGRAEAVEALGRLGPGIFDSARRVVADPNTSDDLLEALIAVLGARPEQEAAGLLWEILLRGGTSLRIRAARALWRREDRPRGEELEALILAEAREGFLQAGLRHGLVERGFEPRFFLQELQHEARQTLRRVVAMAGLLFPRDSAERIWSNLERGATRHRAGAVELIDQLCPRHLAGAVVPLLEGASPPFGQDLPEDLADAYEQAHSHPFETVCGLSSVELRLFLCYELPDRLDCCADLAGTERGEDMRSLIEKMLFLKGVGMFSELGGEELRRVAEISEEVSLPAGRTIFRRGDPGDAMYLVLDGLVRIVVDGRIVAELGPGECFGEMALLDAEPRSADAKSGGDVELLKIRGEDFDELLAQKHEIARGILRVLSSRLRRANVSLGAAGDSALSGQEPVEVDDG